MDERIARLSEAIALKHEARPTFRKHECQRGSFDDFDGKSVCLACSDNAPWSTDWWFITSLDDWSEWHPFEIDQPEIAMRLLKELLADRDVSFEWSFPPDEKPEFFCCVSPKHDEDGFGAKSYVGQGKDQNHIELAIAEAYCKANGLTLAGDRERAIDSESRQTEG